MTRLGILPLIVLFLSTSAAAAAEPQGELFARIAALGDAYRDGDVEALEGLIASSYSHINNGAAPIGREAWLGNARSRAERVAGGSLQVLSYEVSELRVIETGPKAAIVTGRVKAAETIGGAQRDYDVRFTTLWTREDGAWKRAAFHDSPARE